MAGKIVVGIDGTENAAAALRWAVEEGALRGASVEALHAWDFVPVTTPADSGLVPMVWTEGTDVLDAARETAERLAADQVRDVLGENSDVTVSLVQRDASEALLEAAVGADLLVVGNRGRGAFAEALLGSTSGRISDHAPCPVVIVRAHPS
jgi:nucleotide-binding universal stress UspA family protein